MTKYVQDMGVIVVSEIDLLIQELRDTIDNQRETIEQLENIIKEAIEYIDERFTYDEETGEYYLTHTFDRDNVFDLLNILNKGDNKE